MYIITVTDVLWVQCSNTVSLITPRVNSALIGSADLGDYMQIGH